MTPSSWLSEELDCLKTDGLYRALRTVEKVAGLKVTIAGREYINFCSNNYLGLADHPRVVESAVNATKEFGFGAGASRLICGHTVLHEKLEKKLAGFKGREAALVFPTGYMANAGAITSLLDENDAVIIDRLNHASIIDACRLSKAKLQVYPHKDMAALEKILKKSNNFSRRLIVTDSVFSMDGDLAPLPEIVRLAKKYKALTMIDEAHATGIIGSRGKGLEEYYGLEGQVDIIMGTLSKAIGSLGGFVAGSSELIDYLRNKARSFIYTTALSPAACAAARTAIEIIETLPELREKLWDNINWLKKEIGKLGYDLSCCESPILPLLIGDLEKTISLSQELFDNGILASGIRPPTVPKNSCRIRLTVSALHERGDLAALAEILAGAK